MSQPSRKVAKIIIKSQRASGLSEGDWLRTRLIAKGFEPKEIIITGEPVDKMFERYAKKKNKSIDQFFIWLCGSAN